MKLETAQVAYKKGDVCLFHRCGWGLSEVIILDVSQAAKAIKTDIDGWMTVESFNEMVKGKIGHVEMRGFFIFKWRVVVRVP
jgi:hypothetical protein